MNLTSLSSLLWTLNCRILTSPLPLTRILSTARAATTIDATRSPWKNGDASNNTTIAVKVPSSFSSFNGVSQSDPLTTYWPCSTSNSDENTERRERKGWKVKIHDLPGSAVAAAFITTPFVP